MLQSTDFPPLSSGPSTRQPVVGGAWTNASTSRVMMPGPQGAAPPQGTALVHYPSSQQNSPQIPASTGRFEEPQSQSQLQDAAAFERPSPKNAELFNPKGGPRNGAAGILPMGGGRMENGRARANDVPGLSEKMGAMGLDEGEFRPNGVAQEGAPVGAAVADRPSGDSTSPAPGSS